MKNQSSHYKSILKNQAYHLLAWLVIGALLYFAAEHFSAKESSIRGLSTFSWILISWIFAGLHQAWIVFFWRMELYTGKISRWLGKSGFLIFRIGFIVFSLIRLFPVIPVSLSTANTMSIPPYVTIPIIVISIPFILWGLYSVIFYFSVTRAFGADHFDPSYRKGTLEKRGIFKYIPNSMYTIILLMLYHPGLLLQSPLGLITAAAHHAFVWVHYFCTEKPDMKVIYGDK